MQTKSGLLGITLTIIGVVLLLFTFYTAFNLFLSYSGIETSSTNTDLVYKTNLVLIQTVLLGVMVWVGSTLLGRGVDFIRVDRGVGVVTFKVDKGVGLATLTERSERSALEKKEG